MITGSTPGATTPDSRLSVFLSYAVLLAGIGTGIASAYIIITTYSPLPHWDEWALFAHLATAKAWSLSWLWAQHNEHRILVPKIFFLLDVDLFRGTQAFLLTSIFSIQLLQTALLSFSLWTLGEMRGSTWRTGTGLIAYCVLCPTQQENLIWGFQLQFVIPAAMATLAILTLLLYYRKPRAGLLLLSILAATIATWSLANGMLLWPLLLLAALLFGMPRSVLLAITVTAAANIGLYLYHYHRPGTPAEFPGLVSAVGGILHYVAIYFGSTFVRHSSGWIALLAGTIGLCSALIIIVHIVLQRGTTPLLRLQLSLLMLLCMATAAITASGRLHLGLEQATASRYQTFALLFWCSLGLSMLSYLQRDTTRLNLFSGSLILLMLGFATQVRLPLIDAEWRQLRLERISLSLLTGVHDPAALADAYPDPQTVLRAAQYMKHNRLSIFAGDLYARLGQPFSDEYRVMPATDCSGYISSMQRLPADHGLGLRIAGFVWDKQSNRPARNMVAVTNGHISGYGSSVSIPQDESAATPDANSARFGWVAYVRDIPHPDKIELYAVVGSKTSDACLIAEETP